MNNLVDLAEWKQKKASKQNTACCEIAEADFTHYEEILEILDLLPTVLVTRVVKYCLAHYVTFEDLRRQCDY